MRNTDARKIKMSFTQAWNIASSNHIDRYSLKQLSDADQVLRASERFKLANGKSTELINQVVWSLSNEYQRRLTEFKEKCLKGEDKC